MNDLIPFKYENNEVRAFEKDGKPWFIASDVCTFLELENVSRALSRISDKHKGVTISNTLGGEQRLLIIDEPGLYKLIFTSRKPEAEAFQDWVYEKVLPTIRRTGSYSSSGSERALLPSPLADQIVRAAAKGVPDSVVLDAMTKAIDKHSDDERDRALIEALTYLQKRPGAQGIPSRPLTPIEPYIALHSYIYLSLQSRACFARDKRRLINEAVERAISDGLISPVDTDYMTKNYDCRVRAHYVHRSLY